MTQWTAERWQQISGLLDQGLEFDGAERERWLVDLEASEADLGRELRALLKAHELNSAAEFLKSSPLSHGTDLPPGLPADADDSRLIGKLFGPYRVLSLLGRGGMGSVWLAERVDGLFTRRVALKLVHLSLTGRAVAERFNREREILAGLSHPNIARLFDAGLSDDGQPYLALEYIAGTTLTMYCDERRLGVRPRMELFRQVLTAVQYAHAHLVIHRDLKPSNILVTAEGRVQLLDFGIAKLLTEGEAKETELTQLGGRAFTPDYAAPEQIAGAPITIAADVYSLGVMLYELLTGERPYRLKRDSRGALEEAILQIESTPPSRVLIRESAALARATSTAKKLASELKGDLDTIVMKSLKKSPVERYATANAFDEDIERFLRGDVVLAQPDSVAYRTLKFARRHWVGIAAAGILLLTLAGGLAATTYEARVASTQRDATLQAQMRSLTQTAASRLKDGDVSSALGIILEVLGHGGGVQSYAPEALNVFQEARATDVLTLAITGHTERLRSAAFSPDGRFIVTASQDKTARIWDSRTGRQVMMLRGHTAAVISASFSPNGQRVVTSSFDKTARIWDVSTGQQLLLLSGHADRVRCAEFSPDGERVVTASTDKTARVWDGSTGQQLVLLSGHSDSVNCAAFSSDGRQIVTASNDKTARIWDARTGREVERLTGHTDRVIMASFSRYGQRVVTASGDKSARVWEVATGREIMRLRGHMELLATAAFSPDDERIATAAYDDTARIWNAATGEELQVLRGHSNYVESAAFSPDGRRIVTASSDKTARVWDAVNDRELVQLKGHEDLLPFATFSPDGNRVVTASFDKTAGIWDSGTGKQLMLLRGHTNRVISARFSADGKRVVTASTDKSARTWDAATGHEIIRLSGHTDYVLEAAFSPDGRHIVTASVDKSARIWDATTGRQVLILNGHTSAVEGAAFAPDGNRVVTASDDNTGRIWDVVTGRQLILLSGHTNVVERAAYSADGGRIITGSDDSSARIWDASSGTEIMQLSGHRGPLNSVAFSADGRRIVTSSSDKTTRIWDAATGQQLQVLVHPEAVQGGTAFSPDGKRVVTASTDGIARIWDVTTAPLEVQISWVEAATFDPLSSAERFRLGLPESVDIRQWPEKKSKCDELAAAPYDSKRRAPGAGLENIEVDIAVEACAQQDANADNDVPSMYQHGRAQMAGRNFPVARRDFERALAAGYEVARIDLGMLLSTPSDGMLDVRRAVSLFEQAWNHGISIGAFELGALYERGVSRTDGASEFLFAPDRSLAWIWYQKAAAAGEPDSLARFAQRAEEAASSNDGDAKKRNANLLDAFKYYTAAAERTRYEGWPDESRRPWRYRRASLARILAHEGMMQDVASVYEDVRRQFGIRSTERAGTGASALGVLQRSGF